MELIIIIIDNSLNKSYRSQNITHCKYLTQIFLCTFIKKDTRKKHKKMTQNDTQTMISP